MGNGKSRGAIVLSEFGEEWLWSETTLEADALRENVFSKILSKCCPIESLFLLLT